MTSSECAILHVREFRHRKVFVLDGSPMFPYLPAVAVPCKNSAPVLVELYRDGEACDRALVTEDQDGFSFAGMDTVPEIPGIAEGSPTGGFPEVLQADWFRARDELRIWCSSSSLRDRIKHRWFMHIIATQPGLKQTLERYLYRVNALPLVSPSRNEVWEEVVQPQLDCVEVPPILFCS